MSLFWRQIWTLCRKNWIIILQRRWASTPIRALLVPILLVVLLSFAKNFLSPPANFGIGTPAEVLPLDEAFSAVTGGRDRIIFVNNGFEKGDIDAVILKVSKSLPSTTDIRSKTIRSDTELAAECRSSSQGSSRCIAAVTFHSSPSEGSGEGWNYTMRADGILGRSVDVDFPDNDAQIYTLPLQHVIDFTIGRHESPDHNISKPIFEYPYTSQTNQERDDATHSRYMGNIISALGVAFYIAMVGVLYHLTGHMAAERESGMSRLLDIMMPNQQAWQPQAARLLSHQFSFVLVYLAGWAIMGAIMGTMVFVETSVVILIVSKVACGLSLTSFAIFCGSCFREAQLSGITAVITSLVLAVVAQVTQSSPTWVAGILAFLFPPSNYIYLIVTIARWERENRPANVVATPPDSGIALPVIAFWIFSGVHTVGFLLLAAVTERVLFGATSGGRAIQSPGSPVAVSLNGFSKTYGPSWIRTIWAKVAKKTSQQVHAVKGLDLQVYRGEVTVLLGANGSGKSTTLDAVAGMHSATAGGISLSFADSQSAFGHCPQKNVLWDDLTVLQHANIFQGIKNTRRVHSFETETLVRDCDLSAKISTRSKALSGGQKRKLQLVLMFAGNSSICCVDEVSSGVDPLSRRKLWDILLAQRGRRTILLTTHFLDEADVLADRIAIMSHGSLKAHGTSAELKQRMTSGYSVHVPKASAGQAYRDIPHAIRDEEIIYLPGSSSTTAPFLKRLESDRITDYHVNGPTLEEVFLRVAEVRGDNTPSATRSSHESTTPLVETLHSKAPASSSLHLHQGHPTSVMRQFRILFMKRLTVFRRNYATYLIAIALPVIAAGCASIFLGNVSSASCDPSVAELSDSGSSGFASPQDYKIVLGPEDQLSDAALDTLANAPPGAATYVDTLEEFNLEVRRRTSDLMPGGIFLGDEPTFAWRADGPLIFGHTLQNILNSLILNITIISDFQPLDIPVMGNTSDQLIFTTILGFAMAIYPAFLVLYPTMERTRGIRSMQYSNGVTALPTWLSHLTFDFLVTLLVGSLVIIVLRAVTNIWYHLGYLFLVFLLYGTASTLFAYTISLLAESQLGAFAVFASVQSGAFLVFFITYMVTLTYVDPSNQSATLSTAFYVMGTLAPVCNLARGVYLALNMFGVACRGREIAPYPGAIDVYGGPILYLCLQSILLFSMLWLKDSGVTLWRGLPRFTKRVPQDQQNSFEMETGVASRGDAGSEGLEVVSLTKQFKRHLAVDNVSFQVPKSECFALLGPNGAGKTTCISMIRGEVMPSSKISDVLVDGVSALRHPSRARARLGVCPQIDALDKMTVVEHLCFYAQIRGLSEPKHNVDVIMDSLGLRQYSDRRAEALSGGNKRKLSLGIALMGNPSVLLLDEPSSGMDAASMRMMWRILLSVTPGRSLLLTTHSMEEADALATRAGIVAGRMLASGTTDELRLEYGDRYFVHLVHREAPHTSVADTEMIERWIQASFPRAHVAVNGPSYGQVRFEIPRTGPHGEAYLASVFQTIEQGKDRIGIEYYSVSRATLEQVFLGVLEKHDSRGEE